MGHVQDTPVSTNSISNECKIYHKTVHIVRYDLGPKKMSKSKIHILPILNNGSENRYSGAQEGGWTPLHLAAKYLHKDVCKLILGHVTDKHPIVDNIGKDTPQHLMFHAQCKCWRESKNFFE